MTTSSNEPPEHESSDWFVTTRWTVVRTASGPTSVLAQEALQRLCTAYWPPLYAYVRRKGHGEHEAQDLTQEFFARLLARNDFAGLDPGRGRFRAFLLASMNHFLAKEWRKAATLKRGAGQPAVPLDTVLAERCYATLASVEATPEQLFDRRWAETILESAGNRLRAEFVSQGNDAIFRGLNTFLSVPPGSGDYAAVALRLNTTEAAVAKSVERLRRRYRELVRDEIAQTVSTPAELQEELRYLLEVMA